ncbi:MAG: AMP-binding protein [Mesorhizobium sp.]|nr:AMP-binding protein [Mesorhizobium sp.]MCO5164139.1 AMP-binding protein [Mesorhizobium sp.]
MANLANHLFRQARERGGKRALVFEGGEYSFADIADRVKVIAGGLSAAGVTVGTRVGLMMHSRPEFIFFQQAIFALGAVVSPLNIFYKKGELAYVVSSCDLEFLIVGEEFVDRLPEIGTPGTETLRRVFVLGGGALSTDPRLASANNLQSMGKPIDAPVQIPETSVGMMLNTSATTGKAKGVMLSLGNIGFNYDATPGWLGLDENTVTLCALPLYNTFGLNQCINALMVTGGSMVLMQRFDPEQCIKLIEKYGCTFFPGVPTMLQKLFDHPEARNHDLSSISRIMTGAAPVPAALLERIYAFMGRDTVVMTGYGLTEGTALATLEHIELDDDGKVKRPKSIGRILPGMEMRMVKEDGSETAPGEVGEICMRGPHIMLGYYRMPDDTAAALAGGWLHTGDLGMVDESGHGYIVDRKKDVIIRGGQNIYPADIEEVIYHIPGVSEVAVVGASDEALGEIPVAYVAMKPGETVSAEALINKCKEELAYFKVPAAVHFLPELPKGPTGKILRRGLRPQ